MSVPSVDISGFDAPAARQRAPKLNAVQFRGVRAKQATRAAGEEISAASEEIGRARSALGLKDIDQSLPAGPAPAWTPPVARTAPAVPPVPPLPPSGGGPTLSSGSFGPGHPFYAQLNAAPAVPLMPAQAPTAGLGQLSSPQFLGTPAGKVAASATSKLVGAAGKALVDAAKPRASAPTYTSGPGWRSN